MSTSFWCLFTNISHSVWNRSSCGKKKSFAFNKESNWYFWAQAASSKYIEPQPKVRVRLYRFSSEKELCVLNAGATYTRVIMVRTSVPLDAASQVVDVRRPQLQVLRTGTKPDTQTSLKQLCQKTKKLDMLVLGKTHTGTQQTPTPRPRSNNCQKENIKRCLFFAKHPGLAQTTLSENKEIRYVCSWQNTHRYSTEPDAQTTLSEKEYQKVCSSQNT